MHTYCLYAKDLGIWIHAVGLYWLIGNANARYTHLLSDASKALPGLRYHFSMLCSTQDADLWVKGCTLGMDSGIPFKNPLET